MPLLRIVPHRACCGWLGALILMTCAAAGAEPNTGPDIESSPSKPSPPGQNGGAPGKPTPALPGTKSPAAFFRELLTMNPGERAKALADRTELQRAHVEARLREYEAMAPKERETRLQQLELSYHLPNLMKLSGTNRAARLEFVPVELRPIIDERLAQFDQLPPEVQRSVLEYESTANYFLRVSSRRAGTAPPLSPPPLPQTDDDRSHRLSARFSRFVALPADEQQKALEALPAAERDEMERTLTQFAKLPPEQRENCIRSFEKFNRMGRQEREQFLKNAARWKAMTPQERETWRTLVSILPPRASASTPPPLSAGAESSN